MTVFIIIRHTKHGILIESVWDTKEKANVATYEHSLSGNDYFTVVERKINQLRN